MNLFVSLICIEKRLHVPTLQYKTITVQIKTTTTHEIKKKYKYMYLNEIVNT